MGNRLDYCHHKSLGKSFVYHTLKKVIVNRYKLVQLCGSKYGKLNLLIHSNVEQYCDFAVRPIIRSHNEIYDQLQRIVEELMC